MQIIQGITYQEVHFCQYLDTLEITITDENSNYIDIALSKKKLKKIRKFVKFADRFRPDIGIQFIEEGIIIAISFNKSCGNFRVCLTNHQGDEVYTNLTRTQILENFVI